LQRNGSGPAIPILSFLLTEKNTDQNRSAPVR